MSTPRTQSLSRALDLLRALKRFPHGATTATLARATGLAPATAGRLLATLGDAEFVTRSDHGWKVGPEITRIAVRADPHRALRDRARPVLEQLAGAARESCMLAVPRPGPQIEILAQADGPRLLGLTNWVGRPVDMHASAAGKIVLAELSDDELAAWIRRERPKRLTPHTLTGRTQLTAEIARVRERDWATLDQESEIGLGSIARAVRDRDGALTAILGFSGPAERLDYPQLLAHLERGCQTLV
ncbi:MAG: IclR family transcriptional regulator [Solirubrobacterales bacterium]|nr:IclR family transcriptional regulator [Solirubrobacterales bacterium]MBV9715848.1 IclR family transcriptional regulator [Solirubrobacterales bacterium]